MMKRAPRIEGKALTYYISSEGKSEQKIFMDDEDKLFFINLLCQQIIKNNLKFYGYVLLPKQYSFLVENNGNFLSRSMHRINSDYANYFNRRHNHRNKLFKDHYSCIVINKKYYLAEVSYYLHLLPKKNGVAKSIFQYKWSSLPGYINREKREDWIDYNSILSMFNGKSCNASLNYQKYIKKSLKKQNAFPFVNLIEGNILGSEDFKREVLKKQHLNKIDSQKGIPAKKIIELAAQFPHLSPILSRNAAIYFIKKYTDLSNQKISSYFKSLKKSSISQMRRRFSLAKEKNETIKKITNSLEEKIKIIINSKKIVI